MARMTYQQAIEFAAAEGEDLAQTYDYGYAGKPSTKKAILENAAGDIMVATIAAIFGKSQQAVARAVITKQKEES